MDTIEVPAEWASVERLMAFADQLEQNGELNEDQLYLLRMVIEEIATNIIKYGYPETPGVIQLACGVDDGQLLITIRDHGIPFDPRETPDPDLDSGLVDRPVGGLGIFFVREFADQVDYQHDPTTGWNTLSVIKYRRQRSLIERLRNTSLFTRISEADLAVVAARVSERLLTAGEVLFREGSEGKSCFVILSGALEVLTELAGEEFRLEVRQAGQIIGEMALIDRSPRSATVRATVDSSLAELDEQGFYALMHADPEVALELLRSGTARLRRTNRDMISNLESKNAQLSKAYQDLQAAQHELIRLNRIEEELSVARRIQQLFLPRRLNAPVGWEIAALSRGAQAVGGDFFDYIALPDGRLGLVVADVAGKGVPAALFVALARSLLRAASLSPTLQGGATTPDALMAQAIELTNSYMVREHGDSNMFITLFYGVLDPQTGMLHYMNAGHNPPMLLGLDGSVRELELGCLPIGVIEDQDLRLESITIEPGEALIGFSDGITEAMDPTHSMFGEERLMTTLAANVGATAEALVREVVDAVDTFVMGAAQSDDITVMILRRLPTTDGVIA
jgi:serine phosphatase RsbU (regulator of sigma subunit)/anti-sigma regulatory factor (Ser/Thr protein kinase)